MADEYKANTDLVESESNVFDYINAEETSFQTTRVPVTGNWHWSMAEHINRSILYKFGQLMEGNVGLLKPVKNIIWPILNVAYRSEGFDVKDIEPFVNDENNFHKSFFVRKYHPRWARKYNIDTFIDEVVESSVDFDLVLVKNVNEERPEVVKLSTIAFCDQTDVLAGAICLKHSYSVDQLKDMVNDSGWYENEVNEAIKKAKSEKATKVDGQKAKTTLKNIDVYELHGVFPETWLDPEGDSGKYVRQIQIVTFVKSDNDEKKGLCLFKGKSKNIFKALVVNPISGRACGYGGVEALFQPQIWSNYTMIQMKELLDQATLLLMQTSDPAYDGNKNLSDKEKGEILVHKEGHPLTQVTIQPQNFQLFDNFLTKLEDHARITGSANEAQLGINPTSGTPLGTTEIVTNQGIGIHEYRKGKIANFIGEIYRDWTLKFMSTELDKGDKWLEELSFDELQWVADRVIASEANQRIKDRLLKGELTSPEDQQFLVKTLKEEFMKSGNKKFIDAVKGELKGLETDVYVNVAGKQQNLSKMTDKITNIFRFIFANPQGFQQAMMIPGMQKAWNEILEYSGLSQADFGSMVAMPVQPNQPVVSPLQENNLAIANEQ